MASNDSGNVTRRAVVRGVLLFWSSYAITTRAAAAQKTYGVIMPDSGIDYYRRMIEGIREEAKAIGTINLIEGNYKDLSDLVRKVDDMVSRKVDGLLIVLQAYDNEVATVLRIANEAGIPSVTIEGRLQGASADVSPDFAKAAQLQAQVAVATTGSTSGPYIYVTGPKTEINSILEKTFASNTKGLVTNISIENYSAQETIDKTAGAISKEPDVVAIAASSDFFALNVLHAIKASGKDIKVIGLGATPEGVAAVKKGELTATINLKPEVQGSQALELLNSIAQNGVCPNGQKPPCPPKTVSPEVIAGEGRK